MSKRIPQNPKYQHVKATVDTGASLSRYMKKLEHIRENYKFRKGEIFKRIKITTFVQLLVQVYRKMEEDTMSSIPPMTPETQHSCMTAAADAEVQGMGDGGSPAPSLAITEGDYGVPPTPDTSRSTLLSVAHGIGELDVNDRHLQQQLPHSEEDCPYLLLDVREYKDEFDMCHIRTAAYYPKSSLARTVNYDTKEMLRYKNAPGKIVIVYDEDERIAPMVATTLTERGYDNLFMLSGGMKLAYKLFPERLITGTLSPAITGQKPPKTIEMASNVCFTVDDIDAIDMYLDNALEDNSIGTSRLSKASTTSSRMARSTAASQAGNFPSDRPPFKP